MFASMKRLSLMQKCLNYNSKKFTRLRPGLAGTVFEKEKEKGKKREKRKKRKQR
jgi:hypothetical protein